jgi:hypothetical protein
VQLQEVVMRACKRQKVLYEDVLDWADATCNFEVREASNATDQKTELARLTVQLQEVVMRACKRQKVLYEDVLDWADATCNFEVREASNATDQKTELARLTVQLQEVVMRACKRQKVLYEDVLDWAGAHPDPPHPPRPTNGVKHFDNPILSAIQPSPMLSSRAEPESIGG